MSLQELSRNSLILVKNLFKEYYSTFEIKLPINFIMREFAFQTFDSETYIRHKAFRTTEELRNFMLKIVPKHSYFSSALYEDPAAEDMESKVWLGADLVFDIDADHVPGCEETAFSLCLGECLGYDYQKGCVNCDGEVIEVFHITNECLDKAKNHLMNLVDILINDFGFPKSKISIYFSGHRGFHVHIECEDKWLTMNSSERREIVDYIKGEGIDIKILGVSASKGKRKSIINVLPRESDGGWRRRIARALLDLGLVDDAIAEFIKGKKNALKHIPEPSINYLDLVNNLRVAIDEKVTIDTKRLIRIPNSINGKAGFTVSAIDLSSINDFVLDHNLSPFYDYVMEVITPFSFPKIKVIDIDIKGEPSKKIKLPGSVAVYLALKGLAYIINIG